MHEIERIVNAHETLIVSVYTTLIEGGYKESTFANRITSIRADLRGFKTNADERIRIVGVKLTEILADTISLTKCQARDKRWKQLRARIDTNCDKVQTLLKDVS